MKCAACGYEDFHKHGISEKDVKIMTQAGMPPFIVIPSVAYNEVSNGTDYERTAVKLYACPKCKTVRLGE